MASKTITYNADTTQFVRNMEQTRQSLLATGDASDRAKAKILENSQQQIEAALKLGKSQETLDRITQQTAASMAAVTEKNAARIENAVERRIVKYRAEAAELEKLGRIQIEGGGHGFSDRQAVSAVVRGGEGNPGIRSMENALTMIPGFAAAAQTLAPIIGFAGLTGLFVEMGIKGYEAFEKVKNNARDTGRAFEDVHEHNQVQIDDLEIQNQKIQDQIGKISGHPNNGMATALLEAKKRADELLVALQADRKELEQLFKEHSVGALESFFTGIAGTGKQEKNILNDYGDLQDKLADAKSPQERQAIAQDRINRNNTEIARLKKEQADSEQAARDASDAAAQFGMDPGVGSTVDNSAKIAEYEHVNRLLKQRKTADSLGEDISSGQQKLGGMKQGNEAEEAARKAAEARMKVIEKANAELKDRFKDDHASMLGAEAAFWEQMAEATKPMDLNRTAILEKATASQEAYMRGLEQMANQAVAQQRKENEAQVKQADQMHEVWLSAGKRSADDEMIFWWARLAEAQEGSDVYLALLKKFNEAETKVRKEGEDAQLRSDRGSLNDARNGGRLANAGLKLRESQGQVSPYDAAVQQANINTQLSYAEMAALQKQLADATASKNPEEMFRANEALQKASVDRQIQIQEDAARIVGLTWEGALKNSLNVWAEDAQNTAQQVVQITQQAINGLNKNLVDAMFGDKTNFAGMFKDIGKTIAGDGLKQIEGAGLKALGIQGKPDGTASNPLHVVMAGGLFGGSGSGFADAAKSSAAKFFSSKSDDDDSDDSGGSSFVGKTLGFFGSLFGGGKAVGGDVQPGVSYDVGEMGRERFVPKTAGTIIPTHMLGGGHTFKIDARGSNNPAETAAMVREGIISAIPHIAKAANGMNSDRNSRRPPSKAR